MAVGISVFPEHSCQHFGRLRKAMGPPKPRSAWSWGFLRQLGGASMPSAQAGVPSGESPGPRGVPSSAPTPVVSTASWLEGRVSSAPLCARWSREVSWLQPPGPCELESSPPLAPCHQGTPLSS